jgi:hypothetical protein
LPRFFLRHCVALRRRLAAAALASRFDAGSCRRAITSRFDASSRRRAIASRFDAGSLPPRYHVALRRELVAAATRSVLSKKNRSS